MSFPYGEIRLGKRGSEFLLPEVTEFSEDIVRMGINHQILNGMVVEDRFGVRHNFFLKWDGLSKEEADLIKTILYSRGSLSLLTFEASRQVKATAALDLQFTQVRPELTDNDLSSAANIGPGEIFLMLDNVEKISGISMFLLDPISSMGVYRSTSFGDTPPLISSYSTVVYVQSTTLAAGLHRIEFNQEVDAKYIRADSMFLNASVAAFHPLSRRFDVVQSNSEPIRYWNSGPSYGVAVTLEQAVR